MPPNMIIMGDFGTCPQDSPYQKKKKKEIAN